MDAEGHGQHSDGHAVMPALSLATRFCRANSSDAEDQNDGGKDVVALPATSVFAPAPALAPTPPPLLPLTATPLQRTTLPRRLVSPLRQHLWPPSHNSEPCQLNGSDAVDENGAFPTAKRRQLDSSGDEEEDQPRTTRRRLVLRPPRPPLPAQLSHDAECCQPGSSDNGTASGLGDIDAAFQDCLRMSPLDGHLGSTAEAAYLPKPSPSLLAPSSPLVGETLSLAGPTRCPPTGLLALPTSAEPSAGMQASLAALEADSQAACLAHVKREQSDKSTAGTYKRHVDRYEKWWEGYQVERMNIVPGWTTIPAFPITAAKAAMFLGYESTHEKVCFPSPFVFLWLPSTELVHKQKMMGRKSTIPNLNVGKEAISQAISALEHWCFNHAHMYRDIPDAQTPLRSDSRVRTIETAKKHDEPK
jgi:hypothetical protein